MHSERIELSKEARAGWLVDKGGAEGFAVAGLELVGCPVEMIVEAGVFLLKGDVGNGAGVGADAERDAGAVEVIDWVVGVAEDGARLDVAGGTDF